MIIKARKEGSQGQMDLEPLPVGVRDEDEDGHTRHPKARDIVTAIRMKVGTDKHYTCESMLF